MKWPGLLLKPIQPGDIWKKNFRNISYLNYHTVCRTVLATLGLLISQLFFLCVLLSIKISIDICKPHSLAYQISNNYYYRITWISWCCECSRKCKVVWWIQWGISITYIFVCLLKKKEPGLQTSGQRYFSPYKNSWYSTKKLQYLLAAEVPECRHDKLMSTWTTICMRIKMPNVSLHMPDFFSHINES